MTEYSLLGLIYEIALFIQGSSGSAKDLMLSISGSSYFSYFAFNSEKSYEAFKSEKDDSNSWIYFFYYDFNPN